MLLHQVWKVTFWMAHYDHKTPKRTSLWANTSLISKFWMGQLDKDDRAKQKKRQHKSGIMPVKKYIDKHGKPRYQGTKDLTRTGKLVQQISV